MRGWKLVLALVVAFGMVACSADGPLGGGRVSTVTMRFLTPATVQSLIVEVTGPGIEPAVVLNIDVGADTVATGSLTLPSGSARRFVVTAVDTAGVQTHRADTTITLQPGTNPNLAMRLEPLPSTLGITVTFGGVRLVVPDTSTRTLGVGETATIVAYAIRANGDTISADSLTWGSSNPAIATVAAGRVSSSRGGTAQISVSYHGAAGRITISVGGESQNLCATSDLPSNLQSGLVNFYPFCGTLQDVGGTANTPTNFGVVFGADRFGRPANAVNFDGQSRLEFPQLMLGGNTSVPQVSIALWILPSVINQQQYLYVKDGFWQGIYLELLSDGSVQFVGSQPSPQGYWGIGSAPATVVAGSWQHVVATFNAGSLRLYLNGVLVATGNTAYTALDWSATQAGNCAIPCGHMLGAIESLSSGIYGHFTGRLDDFIIWNRELTAAEIASLYGL